MEHLLPLIFLVIVSQILLPLLFNIIVFCKRLIHNIVVLLFGTVYRVAIYIFAVVFRRGNYAIDFAFNLERLLPIRNEWQRRNRLPLNLFMGTVLCLALVWLRSYPLIGEAEDAGMDWIIKISKERIPASTKDKVPPFVFLDIDNETIKSWEKEKEKTLLLTPRDRLKNLTKMAVDANAKLVVVDINLTLATPVEKNQPLPDDQDCQKLKLHQDDCDLYKYLRDDYPKKCEGNSTCSPIILTRSLIDASESDASESEVKDSLAQAITRTVPMQAKRFASSSFLDNVVENQKSYIQWASITFPSSSDQIIRQWQLWYPMCVEKQIEFVYSVQLLVAGVIYHGNLQKAHGHLDKELARFNQTIDCDVKSYIPPQEQEKIKVAEGFDVSASSGGVSQRIVYKMRWLTEKDRRLKAIKGNRYCLPTNRSLGVLPKYCLRDTSGNEILTVFSAHDMPNIEMLADKIVIIGGSRTFGNISDMHPTPIGEMPGALVVINAIHSLLSYPEISTFPWYLEIIGLWLFTLVVTWIFTQSHDNFHLTAAKLGIVVIPIMVFISWLFIWYVNTWLSFVTPLLIIYYGHIMMVERGNGHNDG